MLCPSEFRKKMRAARPPIAVGFDLDAFKQEIKTLSDNSDLMLAATAIWIHAQSITYGKRRELEPLVPLERPDFRRFFAVAFS